MIDTSDPGANQVIHTGQKETETRLQHIRSIHKMGLETSYLQHRAKSIQQTAGLYSRTKNRYTHNIT